MDIVPGVTQLGHYIFQASLGTGAFASVWLALHTVTRVKVAIKVIRKSTITDSASITRLTRELHFLQQLHHPFICEFYEWLEDAHSYYYVMEYAENGTLLARILKGGALTETQSRRYFAQLLSVLEYLHSDLHLCHRDIKPDNLLLDRHDNVRVIDFGLSNQFTSANPALNTACGSPPYAPPEMIRGEPYTQAADVWSSGVLLYAATTGRLPYDDANVHALLRKIVSQDVQYPSFLSPALVDLLRRMLTKAPEMRITLDGIRAHEWFGRAEYAAAAAVRAEAEGVGGKGVVVEQAVVEEMERLGIETRALKQQFLIGEATAEVAMYRMIRRERSADEVQVRLEEFGRAGMPERAVSACQRVRVRTLGIPRVRAYSPVIGKQSPTVVAVGNVKKGVGGQPVIRRFSRPVVIPRIGKAAGDNGVEDEAKD